MPGLLPGLSTPPAMMVWPVPPLTTRLPRPVKVPLLVTTRLFWNECVPPCNWNVAALLPSPTTKFCPLLYTVPAEAKVPALSSTTFPAFSAVSAVAHNWPPCTTSLLFSAEPLPIVTLRFVTKPPVPICSVLFVAPPAAELPITSVLLFKFQILEALPPAMLTRLLLALLPAVALPIVARPAVNNCAPLVISRLSPLSLLPTFKIPTLLRIAALPLPSRINRLYPTTDGAFWPSPTLSCKPPLFQVEVAVPPTTITVFDRDAALLSPPIREIVEPLRINWPPLVRMI